MKYQTTKETISLPKMILFSCLIFISFFLCIEVSARVYLAAKHRSTTYFLYGLKDVRRFKEVKDNKGNIIYYKGVPFRDKNNPVNSLGFRGEEIQIKKNVPLRIICLGSSTTYGDGLDYEDTYPAILQKKLNLLLGDRYCEVINAGISGFDLRHIYAMTENEILSMEPDIITISNINNNFHAPGFWFVDVQGQKAYKINDGEQNQSFIKKSLQVIKNELIKKSAIFFLINNVMLQGMLHYITNFDWNAFASALMRHDNIWERPFKQNLFSLIRLIRERCPSIKIILLTEAVNSIDFPSLEKPFKHAYDILDNASKQYDNVYVLDIYSPILKKAQQKHKVWSDPTAKHDPLHLSRQGNEIIAETLASFLMSYIKIHTHNIKR